MSKAPKLKVGINYWRWVADKRLELLRDALEFIDGMTLQEAELRMAIEKELAGEQREEDMTA